MYEITINDVIFLSVCMRLQWHHIIISVYKITISSYCYLCVGDYNDVLLLSMYMRLQWRHIVIKCIRLQGRHIVISVYHNDIMLLSMCMK